MENEEPPPLPDDELSPLPVKEPPLLKSSCGNMETTRKKVDDTAADNPTSAPALMRQLSSWMTLNLGIMNNEEPPPLPEDEAPPLPEEEPPLLKALRADTETARKLVDKIAAGHPVPAPALTQRLSGWLTLNLRKNTLLLIAAFLLIVAANAGKYEHGFFIFLRFVVCPIAIYIAWLAYEYKQKIGAIIFGFAALLFNPLLRPHFEYAEWQVIDVVTALSFSVAVFALRFYGRTTEQHQRILAALAVADEVENEFARAGGGDGFALIKRRVRREIKRGRLFELLSVSGTIKLMIYQIIQQQALEKYDVCKRAFQDYHYHANQTACDKMLKILNIADELIGKLKF